MRKLIAVICLSLMAAGCTTMSLSDYVTPAEIDQDAVEYVEKAGVAKSGEYEGYGNLYKAVKLQKDVEAAHRLNLQDIEHLAEDENLHYSIHTDTTSINATAAIQKEQALFGEEGLLSLGLTIAGVSGFAGLLGLMRKRPGDMTKADYENALAAAKGEAVNDLSLKEKQFCQLVKGIQEFLDFNPENNEQLRDSLVKATDEETKKAVAVVKATL